MNLKNKIPTEFTIGSNTIKSVINYFKKKKGIVSNKCDYCTWRSNPDMCLSISKNKECPFFTTKVCPLCDRNPCICYIKR